MTAAALGLCGLVAALAPRLVWLAAALALYVGVAAVATELTGDPVHERCGALCATAMLLAGVVAALLTAVDVGAKQAGEVLVAYAAAVGVRAVAALAVAVALWRRDGPGPAARENAAVLLWLLAAYLLSLTVETVLFARPARLRRGPARFQVGFWGWAARRLGWRVD